MRALLDRDEEIDEVPRPGHAAARRPRFRCPARETLVLWGNPLAQLAPRESGQEVPVLGSAGAFLVLRKPEPPGKPRLHTLYADPVVLDEELPAAPPFQVRRRSQRVFLFSSFSSPLRLFGLANPETTA